MNWILKYFEFKFGDLNVVICFLNMLFEVGDFDVFFIVFYIFCLFFK